MPPPCSCYATEWFVFSNVRIYLVCNSSFSHQYSAPHEFMMYDCLSIKGQSPRYTEVAQVAGTTCKNTAQSRTIMHRRYVRKGKPACYSPVTPLSFGEQFHFALLLGHCNRKHPITIGVVRGKTCSSLYHSGCFLSICLSIRFDVPTPMPFDTQIFVPGDSDNYI